MGTNTVGLLPEEHTSWPKNIIIGGPLRDPCVQRAVALLPEPFFSRRSLPTNTVREHENILALQKRFGDKLLILNVSNHVESLTYKRLAGFLGVEAPDEPFPRVKTPGHFPVSCGKDYMVKRLAGDW